MTLPVSLPRLANSLLSATLCEGEAYGSEKNEFASLPRFLSGGVEGEFFAIWQSSIGVLVPHPMAQASVSRLIFCNLFREMVVKLGRECASLSNRASIVQV